MDFTYTPNQVEVFIGENQVISCDIQVQFTIKTSDIQLKWTYIHYKWSDGGPAGPLTTNMDKLACPKVVINH